jgi:hypothetical protein
MNSLAVWKEENWVRITVVYKIVSHYLRIVPSWEWWICGRD